MASGVEHMMVLGRSLAYSHESPRGIREPPVYAAYRPSLATLLSATRPSYYHPLIFFRLHPRRFSNRQIVDWLTFTPRTFFKNLHLSGSVAAGRSLRSACNSRLPCSSIFERLPGAFLRRSEGQTKAGGDKKRGMSRRSPPDLTKETIHASRALRSEQARERFSPTLKKMVARNLSSRLCRNTDRTRLRRTRCPPRARPLDARLPAKQEKSSETPRPATL